MFQKQANGHETVIGYASLYGRKRTQPSLEHFPRTTIVSRREKMRLNWNRVVLSSVAVMVSTVVFTAGRERSNHHFTATTLC